MTKFKKYMHVEPLDRVLPILDYDYIYVQPKLDGANAQIFLKDDGELGWGSRNYEQTKEYDAIRMGKYVQYHPEYKTLLLDLKAMYGKDYILYGEWLTPHTLQDYERSAWEKFYIFDIYCPENDSYLSPPLCDFALNKHPDIPRVPYIGMFESGDPDIMEKLMDICENQNHFLMKDGKVGEGIVIKNYSNGYENTSRKLFESGIVWGKIVRADFKAKAKAVNKGMKILSLEGELAVNNVDEEFISKEYYKFTSDEGVVWTDKMIPDFIKRVWEEWWRDYSFKVLGTLDESVNLKLLRKSVAGETVKCLKDIQRKAMKHE